jgi:hypothetical protein
VNGTVAVVRRLFAVALIGLAGSGVAACKDDRVNIAFRPSAGATYVYDAKVTSSTVSQLPGQEPRSSRDEATLNSTLRVIDASGATTRVEVVVSRPGTGSRSYVMRFDRAAQLTNVESVEGIPSDALGELGLTEIFPAAAGAPPDRLLRTGDRWSIDDMVQLNAGEPATRLTGFGRLSQLGVVDGRRTATVTSTTSLPLHSTGTDGPSRRMLDGTQTTDVTVSYNLDDGAVGQVSAVTTAHYTVTFVPPDGQPGTPVTGTLTVVVRSEIARR